MGYALGWVAVALAGVAAAPMTERTKAQINYTVRMVEAQGVDWREGVYSRLKPVTRQGSATVWTVPRDAAKHLLEDFSKSGGVKVLQAPTVTQWSGVPATIQHRRNRPVVVQAAWTGQDSATGTASENIRVGWHTTMVGRKLDQGILVQVVFEDTVIRAVHHVNVNRPAEHTCATATDERKQTCTSSATATDELKQTCTGSDATTYLMAMTQAILAAESRSDVKTAESKTCCQSTACAGKDDGVQKVVLDVPEIDTQEILGEWLIPHGEALLVSFGAHTVADKRGMAVVKERLAIIEADLAASVPSVTGINAENPAPVRVPGPQSLDLLVTPPVTASPGQGSVSIVPVLPPRVGALPSVRMPTPEVPSRSIPQGINADGTPADLPRLPEDEMDDDSSAAETSEPMASPQTKKVPHAKPKPATDAGTKKVEFNSPKGAAITLPNVLMPGSSAGLQLLLPMKSMSISLPFGQKLKLEIEVIGNVVPKTTDSP